MVYYFAFEIRQQKPLQDSGKARQVCIPPTESSVVLIHSEKGVHILWVMWGTSIDDVSRVGCFNHWHADE